MKWDFTDFTPRPRKPEGDFRYCGMCDGRGYVRVEPFLDAMKRYVNAKPCNVCDGHGYRPTRPGEVAA